MMKESDNPESQNIVQVVDDEEHIVEGLKALLELAGYKVLTALNGQDAIRQLDSHEIMVTLLDLKLPDMDGLNLFARMKEKGSITQFIFITGQGSIATAVEAMKQGAYDYLTKPVEPERLQSILPRALEHFKLLHSNRELEERIRNLTRYEELVGQSEEMRGIFRMIEVVAGSATNVLILGESGTGKELVARAIHHKSDRSVGPFVALNCAAFPRDILENELFGHEKGAFTGALQEKQGNLELADRGTLFLDEIGDMSPELQAKILRVMEERKFRRLGGRREIEVDVRILAATNQNPREKLRQDLYFRLAVVEIEMPPLRERLRDLSLLASEFLQQFNQVYQKKIQGFTKECLGELVRYPWPGNVRELKNVVERAVLLCDREFIASEHLPTRLFNEKASPEITLPLETPITELEKILIRKNLELTNRNKIATARILGISLKTLYNKMARYNLS